MKLSTGETVKSRSSAAGGRHSLTSSVGLTFVLNMVDPCGGTHRAAATFTCATPIVCKLILITS